MSINYFHRFSAFFLQLPAAFIFLSLIACDNQSNTQAGKSNEPELVTLAEQGNLNKIEELLSLGKKPDIEDSCQWTPLMKAAQYGHIDIVKLLLTKGANVEQADKGNYTAVLLAASRNHHQIVELLLAQGADINHQESTMGWSALIWAAKLNYFETVEVLLTHKADTQLKDFKGNTALMWANTIKSEKMMQLLGH